MSRKVGNLIWKERYIFIIEKTGHKNNNEFKKINKTGKKETNLSIETDRKNHFRL